jgi:hypothetical protein
MSQPEPEAAAPDFQVPDFEVHRVDDNGNEFVVATGLSLAEAEQLAALYEARAHKQMYMVRKGGQRR